FYQVCKNYYFPSFVEPALATELVVSKAKYQELPADLQALIKDICQAEHDQVASDFYANDPRALRTLVDEHGVNVLTFPDDILQTGANAAAEIMTELRESGDALTKKTTERFIEALNILRTRTDQTDSAYAQARAKYFKI